MKDLQFSSIQPGTLVVIWNSDSGWQQALLDSIHKWVSPQTYSCDLCRLTHGGFGPKNAWKDFVASREGRVVFMYRDTFDATNLPAALQGCELPVIMEVTAGGPVVRMTAGEIGEIPDLETLLAALEQRL